MKRSQAGLWGKQGPWKQYPKRMLQMRARGFAIRDAFPDALRGMYMAEEVQDITEKEVVGTHRSVEPAETAPAEDPLKAALRGDTESAADESGTPTSAADTAEPAEDVNSSQQSQASEAGSAIFEQLAAELYDCETEADVRKVMSKAVQANELTAEQRAYLAEQANQKTRQIGVTPTQCHAKNRH